MLHIYDVALTDMLGTVKFMTSRGIALNFILETYSHSSYEIWEPEHNRLLEAGVVTPLDYADFNKRGGVINWRTLGLYYYFDCPKRGV